MIVAIGCDENGFQLKQIIMNELIKLNIRFIDCGTYNEEEKVLYPDIAFEVANKIKDGEVERGILICGTGLGMSIAANKVKGIYAAVCHDIYSAERARLSNNAQILTMGAQVIGSEVAKKIIKRWLECEFSGGRSLPKVNRIKEFEKFGE